MSSTTPLTDAINALTTYANETTGKNDTNLSDAVGSLVDGYGGYTADKIATGEITGDIIVYASGWLRSYAFSETNIISFSAPNITRCKKGCFQDCSKLKSVALPSLQESSTLNCNYLFSNCSELLSVNAPYIRQGADYCFDGCRKLLSYTNKALHNQGINTGAFRNCNALAIIDFTFLNQIAGTWAWNGTNSLTTIILRRSDDIVPCGNANNMPPTIKNNGIGATIYVPSALISSYQSAANWTTLDGYGTITWMPIEGSIYETQYADGTPISTT